MAKTHATAKQSATAHTAERYLQAQANQLHKKSTPKYSFKTSSYLSANLYFSQYENTGNEQTT
jgi:hypothetical protein